MKQKLLEIPLSLWRQIEAAIMTEPRKQSATACILGLICDGFKWRAQLDLLKPGNEAGWKADEDFTPEMGWREVTIIRRKKRR